MMYYLYINYGNIEYEDVVANKHHLAKPFGSNQPIFNLFNRYKDIITIATKRRQPISSQGKN